MLSLFNTFFCFFLFFQGANAAIPISDQDANDLPKILIIGAQKSGTRAFQMLLSQHPQILNRTGEIHFFDLHFEKGVDWYKEQFPQNNCPDLIKVDKSPYYLFHPLAAKRAYEVLPNAKLIVLLRNPIDRAYSQHQMNMRNKKTTISFLDALKKENELNLKDPSSFALTETRIFSYLSRSIYVEQLKRWLTYYPLEQMLIISFDDLMHNPNKVMQEALQFLNLPEYDTFNFQVGEIQKYPPMDKALRQKLSDYFLPYNQELELLLGRQFNWN